MMPSGFLPFEWLLIAALFAFNAVVSAAEIALASLSRGKLAELAGLHPGFGRVLSLWKEHPSQLLTTILVSSNLAVVGLSTVTALMAVQYNEGLGLPAWAVTVWLPVTVTPSLIATLVVDVMGASMLVVEPSPSITRASQVRSAKSWSATRLSVSFKTGNFACDRRA